jgi:hypothetical protein
MKIISHSILILRRNVAFWGPAFKEDGKAFIGSGSIKSREEIQT